MRNTVIDMKPRSTHRVNRHRIRDTIQQMILSGERQPGSRLRQQELAERFGVAQGVVREALLELKANGLVETFDNRGIYVSRLDKNRLLDAFLVREIHEGLAARLCCDRATRAQIKELIAVAEEIYALGAAGQLEEMAWLDHELHARLIRLSSNGMLIRLADNYRILSKIAGAQRNIEDVRGEHIAILESIHNGDADQAERLMRKHVAATRIAVDVEMQNWE